MFAFNSESQQTFIDRLLTKLAYSLGVGDQTGVNVKALTAETNRQVRQTAVKNAGNILTGIGATKSGEED